MKINIVNSKKHTLLCDVEYGALFTYKGELYMRVCGMFIAGPKGSSCIKVGQDVGPCDIARDAIVNKVSKIDVTIEV